jgi:hypothetical protein
VLFFSIGLSNFLVNIPVLIGSIYFSSFLGAKDEVSKKNINNNYTSSVSSKFRAYIKNIYKLA